VAFVYSSGNGSASGNRLWVSNIVPIQSRELKYSEYNYVLSEFKNEIIDPCLREMPMDYELTKDEIGIKDVFDPESADLLEIFNQHANKDGLHPYDEERWQKFVICSHKNRNKVDTGTFKQLLIEELDWPFERATTLIIRYEQEISILKAYDEYLGRS
jgi:hypothetical protein